MSVYGLDKKPTWSPQPIIDRCDVYVALLKAGIVSEYRVPGDGWPRGRGRLPSRSKSWGRRGRGCLIH